jgi:hypothetical protein
LDGGVSSDDANLSPVVVCSLLPLLIGLPAEIAGPSGAFGSTAGGGRRDDRRRHRRWCWLWCGRRYRRGRFRRGRRDPVWIGLLVPEAAVAVVFGRQGWISYP